MKPTSPTPEPNPRSKSRPPSGTAFPRRILLCVTGLTPQVVTETMFALARRTAPFVPTEIHIITTTTGANQVRQALLDPRHGQLGKLCKQYKLALPLCDETTVHVIKHAGNELADMRSAEENDAAADFFLDVVRRLTADGQCQIHFSIAGGRKTMGFYLGYCASLLGRAQDDMSHVLVNTPFENLPAFFFPPNPPAVLYDTRKAKGDPTNLPHDTSSANVNLAPVAFLRLRGKLPPALLQTGRSFSETVRLLNALDSQPSLTLRLLPPHPGATAVQYQVLVAGGYEVKLPPKHFALLWMFAALAKAPKENERTVNEDTWLAIYDSVAFPVYGAVTGEGKRWDNAVLDRNKRSCQHGDFRNQADKLNKLLRDHLGPYFDKIYGITVLGRDAKARYGLRLPASAIHLEDLTGRLAKSA